LPFVISPKTKKAYFYKKNNMVIGVNSVYDELVDFLASLSPRRVLAYKASAKSQARIKELLERNAKNGLSPEEHAEMERYMAVEHIVRLAKSKALQELNKTA
jgi:hypothetical protein